MNAALITAIASLLVSLVTAGSTWFLQRDKLAAERRRFDDQKRLEEGAMRVIRELLTEKEYGLPSFDVIKRRVGAIPDCANATPTS